MTRLPLDIELLRRRDPVMTACFMTALRHFARRYFRTPSDIENVALDALAELLAKLERGDQPESVTQWVVTAASNATKRRLTRRQHVHVPFLSTVHTTTQQATLSETLRTRERLQRAERALAQMPDTTREAVIATSVEGRSTGSVANELGVPPGTLRKDLTRARHQLRRQLTDEEKLERLREVARERRRKLEAERGHSPTPRFSTPRAGSKDSSSVAS